MVQCDYLIFTEKKCLNIIVKADSELSAKRKFIKYLISHPDQFEWDSNKFPSLATTFDGSNLFCIKLIGNKLFHNNTYLGEYYDRNIATEINIGN